MVVLVVNYCGGQIAVPERIRTSSKSFQDSVDFEVRELSLIYRVGHMFPPDKKYQFPRNVCTLAKKILGEISIWM